MLTVVQNLFYSHIDISGLGFSHNNWAAVNLLLQQSGKFIYGGVPASQTDTLLIGTLNICKTITNFS